MKIKFFLLFFVIFMCACQEQKCQSGDLTELSSLKIEQAKLNAKEAFERKNYAFLGFNGFTLEIRGVPDDYLSKNKYEYRVIDNASDSSCSKKELDLVINYLNYSEIYNKEMLKMIKERK